MRAPAASGLTKGSSVGQKNRHAGARTVNIVRAHSLTWKEPRDNLNRDLKPIHRLQHLNG